MGKVYTACMLVDENELDIMLNSVRIEIGCCEPTNESFNELVKVYVKLLKEKESIQHERAKLEPKEESI